MIKVIIIGSGNVAQHLIRAFQNKDILNSKIDLVQVFSRDKKALTHLLHSNKITSDYNAIAQADLYIIAVSDEAISTVSSQLPFENQLVVHTSGTASLNDLNTKNRKGVFYPLQTFSKNKPINFKIIPIGLAAENKTDLDILKKTAFSISDVVYEITSKQRKALHIAAVFVSNFVNHLYQIGNTICDENTVSFDLLKPLIQETANKVLTMSPKMAQTGPAKRNDSKTIETHLTSLTDKEQTTIYKILTQSIQNNDKKL